MINPHFYKITIPNWILGCIGIYTLVFHFSWIYVLYSVLGFYVLGIFGASIGYHRYLAHQSFKTNAFFDWAMIICGSLTGQGSPIFWTALHKHHHKYSDTDVDIHSPRRGLYQSFIGWQISEIPKIQTIANRSMYTHPLIKFIHRNYYKFYWLSVIFVYAINPAFGLFFMTFGGAFILGLAENAGNVAFHTNGIGYRNYDLNDNSRNIWWYSMITLGAGYHNNHHRWPGNYRFGVKWWEIDLGAKFIELIKK